MDIDKCIQCNQCSYVCPHAAIRSFLITDEEKAASPIEFSTLKSKWKRIRKILSYRIQVTPLDCLVVVLVLMYVLLKALDMNPIAVALENQEDKKSFIHFIVK